MINYKHYSYKVIWSKEDQEYVGLCAEFSSLSYLDEDETKAFTGIQELVNDIITEMSNNGEIIPEPISEKDYSGKLQIRIPPTLHRRLAILASEENVSLNRLINYKLAN